jgi:tRNA pseudouridine38-40 synthase
VRATLDVEAMHAAAQSLVGEHDFASFSGPPSYAGQPTIRRVYSADFSRDSSLVYFDIVAESFLPQQVRRTVAQLLRVGKGKADVSVMQRFLDDPVLGSAWEAAPPHALCLEEITYPAGLVPFTNEERRVYAPSVVSLGV